MKVRGEAFPSGDLVYPDRPGGLDPNHHQPIRRRTKRVGGSGKGTRRSRPETPLLSWNVNEEKERQKEDEEEGGGRRDHRRKGAGKPVSARSLVAWLWRLQVPEAVEGKRNGRRSGFQPGASHVGITFVSHHKGKTHGEQNDSVQSPSSVSGGRSKFLCKLELSFQPSNSAMEGVTKWAPVCAESLDEVHHNYSNMKHIDQQVSAVSAVAGLEAELEQAQARIQELETERCSHKKKLEHFLKKFSEERASWRSRKHEKVQALMDNIKADLSYERKSRQRLEIENSKLVNELGNAKVSAMRFVQDYDKERKSRELIEEVCDELAKEIGEDKAEVEALKNESMKLREEVDDERKMLQMAEVWREERVQMKLIDAKVALEEKYSLMNKLVTDLEALLSLRNTTPDHKEVREAETLLWEAASVDIQNVKDFKYEPPNPDDIFSIFEDVNCGDSSEREIEQTTYSPASPASKKHTVSPEVHLIKDEASRHSDVFIDRNRDLEDDESGWETVSHIEVLDNQGFSYSPEESAPSVDNNLHDSNVSGSGTEWEENACNGTPKISELYHVPTKHSRVSSITRLWRSSSHNRDNYKVVAVDAMKGRLSNLRSSNGSILSPDKGSGEGEHGPEDFLDQWSSPDSGNPHVTRGMKGCIEWPRGMQKGSLKSKLIEASTESQKVQLRHVLKQKI